MIGAVAFRCTERKGEDVCGLEGEAGTTVEVVAVTVVFVAVVFVVCSDSWAESRTTYDTDEATRFLLDPCIGKNPQELPMTS